MVMILTIFASYWTKKSFAGIVGRISPKTWSAMEIFLASIGNEEYESMASALIEMGATSTDIDSKAFARDLEKIFSSIKASIIHKSLHVYWKIGHHN